GLSCGFPAAGLRDRRTRVERPVGEGRQRSPRAPHPRRLRRSRALNRWRGKALLASLFAAWMLLGAGGMSGVSADSSSQPAPSAQGIDGLVPPPPNIQQGNQPTLAERYPTTAYTPFTVSVGGSLKDALTNPVQSSANVMFTVWAGTEMEVLLIVAVLTSRLL